MLMWFAMGDAMIRNGETATTKYETREACEAQFIKMLTDSDGFYKPSIKKSMSTGNPTLVLQNADGDNKIVYLCEEVKF